MARQWHRSCTKFITSIIVGVAMLLSLFFVRGNEVCAVTYPSLQMTNNAQATEVVGALSEANTLASTYEMTGFHGKGTAETLFICSSGSLIYINMQGYNDLSAEEKQNIMEAALNCAKTNIKGTQLQLKVYNFIADQDSSTSSLVRQLSRDVNADFATAYSWFKPFSGGVSTFLGIMSLGIFVTLACMITIDLAYLVIPPFRRVLEKDGKEKPSFVSNEAYKATLEAEKGESYKSSMTLYFKHKVAQLVVLAICLLYLVSGKIYSLVAWFIDAFSGVTG